MLLLLLSACTDLAYLPSEPPAIGSVVQDTGDGVLDDDIPCTTYGAQTTTLTVINHRANQVDLFWRNDSCQEILYAQIAGGGSYNQSTYTNAVWTVRTADSSLLDWILIESAQPVTLEVSR
jgi:hypothetical protein